MLTDEVYRVVLDPFGNGEFFSYTAVRPGVVQQYINDFHSGELSAGVFDNMYVRLEKGNCCMGGD
jgi:hypothetical protein